MAPIVLFLSMGSDFKCTARPSQSPGFGIIWPPLLTLALIGIVFKTRIGKYATHPAIVVHDLKPVIAESGNGHDWQLIIAPLLRQKYRHLSVLALLFGAIDLKEKA
jgi:hypothetical protein